MGASALISLMSQTFVGVRFAWPLLASDSRGQCKQQATPVFWQRTHLTIYHIGAALANLGSQRLADRGFTGTCAPEDAQDSNFRTRFVLLVCHGVCHATSG